MSAAHKMLTFKDLLDEVPLSERQLREDLKGLGYTAKGRKMLFTRDQAEAIKGALTCRCDCSSAEKPGTSEAPSPANLSTKLQAQLTGKGRKRSKPAAKGKYGTVVSMANARP